MFNFDYDYWELRDKVTFDGVRREIVVNYGETSLDIKGELYASWKQWVQVRDNAKYLPAMRVAGGDPIPGGATGSTFFLSNGWKLLYDPRYVAITGVLYSDNYDTAFFNTEGSPVYPATVSALVNSAVSYQNVVTGTALTPEQTAAAVWGAAARTLTSSIDPTAAQVAAAVLAEILATVIPANIKQVNDVALVGDGSTTPWGPA